MSARKLIFILLLFCSCNPYRFASRHVTGKVEKAGLSLHTARMEKYTINYWDSQEDKPVLLLIHGLGADTEFHWYKQVGELKDYRIIMPNLLYFGGSVPENDNYSVIGQVRAMQALIKELGLKEFYLCGFSYGGLVAAELAKAETGKVKKLLLFDAPVKYFVREDLQPLLHKYGLKEPSQLLVPKDAKAMKDLTSVIYKHPPHIPAAFYKSFQVNMYQENEEQYTRILRKMESERAYFETQDYKFHFPVLLLWGEDDVMVPSSVGKMLQEHIGSNARFVVIPGTAHVPNLEKPHAFNKYMLDFLKENSAGQDAPGTVSNN